MLLLAHIALAHVPHCVMTAVATDEALAQDNPWFTIHDYGGATTLFRTDDGGDSWSALGGAPMRDALIDAGWTNDGALVLLAADRYWWSTDAGVTWSSADLDATAIRMATGDGVVIATDDGLLVGSVGDVDSVALGEAFTDVSYGPGGFAAVGESLWVDGGTRDWAPLDSPGATPSRALADVTVVYAGRSDGSVLRWDGGDWIVCGATPYADSEHASVVALASDGSRLLVASAGRGPAVSTDGCATWRDIAAPLDSLFNTSGGAKSDEEATSALAVAGDHVIQAGWAGFAFSTDGGESWAQRVVVAPDLLRGVAISPEFETDGVVLLGGFSGGVQRSPDGGRTWAATGLGIATPNIQQIRFAPDDAQRVYADANHALVRSGDGGLTWEDVDAACGSACLGWTVTADGSVWQAGVPVEGNALGVRTHAAVSRDGGVTWADVSGLDTGVEWENFIDTTERLCATGGDFLACSTDDGASWVTVRESPDRVAAMVDVNGAELLSVEEQGIWRIVDGQPTLVWDGSDDPVLVLARADDDALVATTRGARMLRSDDLGVTWFDTGIELTATVRALALRDGFAEHPDVLLASYDGGWLANDAGAQRFGRYERVDNASDFMQSEGVVTTDDPGAALGSCASMRPASLLAATVRGTRVRALGRAGGQSAAVVRVDGLDVGTIGANVIDEAQGELLVVDDLANDWHRVELVGLVGEDLCVDGIEAMADGAVLDGGEPQTGGPETGEPGEPRCGCGVGGGAGGGGGGGAVGGGGGGGGGTVGILGVVVAVLGARRKRARGTTEG